jgi:hypothetical protein
VGRAKVEVIQRLLLIFILVFSNEVQGDFKFNSKEKCVQTMAAENVCFALAVLSWVESCPQILGKK